MKIKWNVDLPLYRSPMPDQILEIDDEEFEGLNEEEKHRFINDIVEEEFLERVSFYWNIVKK